MPIYYAITRKLGDDKEVILYDIFTGQLEIYETFEYAKRHCNEGQRIHPIHVDSYIDKSYEQEINHDH